MPKDHYIANGLDSVKMVAAVEKYKLEFDIFHAEYIDVIDLIEFKLQRAIPDFEFIIRNDKDLDQLAVVTIEPPTLQVKQSIYNAAHEGDVDCRYILAHEIGHLLLHRNFANGMHRSLDIYEEQFLKLNSIESIEKQADMFARHLLISQRLALKYQNDPRKLSCVTGSPLPIAKGSITIAKRTSMRAYRTEAIKHLFPCKTDKTICVSNNIDVVTVDEVNNTSVKSETKLRECYPDNSSIQYYLPLPDFAEEQLD